MGSGMGMGMGMGGRGASPHGGMAHSRQGPSLHNMQQHQGSRFEQAEVLRNRRSIARATFYNADLDQSGALDKREFCHCLESLGMPLSVGEAMAWFDRADRDKNGVISLVEFERFYLDVCESNQKTFMWQY
jgi:EF-hand domain pair